MKKGRSTGKPTKAEAEWIVAVKEGPCLACIVWLGDSHHGVEAHHLLSGGRRIGQMATIGLCEYHHRKVPLFGMSFRSDAEDFGPSLMDGSKLFHEAYGSDAELLEMQRQIVAGSR